jgi:hypothetical protein
MDRERFSINLDEDYELYGIDPNENLDDWSFLDAKPEPLPERTDEERRLFEQLLAPLIPEEEIQTEIHDRLRALLAETTQFLENDVKVELAAPLEVTDEAAKHEVDPESFEHKQAVRMRSIVQDMVRSTQKVEDLADFLHTITGSDEMADELQRTGAISVPDADSPPSSAPQPTPPPDHEPSAPPRKAEEPGLLSRYKRKPSAIKTVMRDLDETERMNSKFLLARKKRQEELEQQAEQERAAVEERQKQFISSLEFEAEKHRRELRMAEAMKNSKPVSLTEMLKQIQQDAPPPQSRPKIPAAKPETKPPAPPRASSEQIAAFKADRDKAFEPPQAPVLIVVDLTTAKLSDPEPKAHYSKTYEGNVQKALKAKLGAALQNRGKRNLAKAWRVAIFLKFAVADTLARKKQVIARNRSRAPFRIWRRRADEAAAARTIQRVWRKCILRKRHLVRVQQSERDRIAREQRTAAEVQEKSVLDRARAAIAARVPLAPVPEAKPKRRAPEFSFPAVQDPDVAWLRGAGGSALELFNDFLEELPDRPPPAQSEPPAQAESQSVPIEEDMDEYLSRFNRQIVVADEPPPPPGAALEVPPAPEQTEEELRGRAQREGYSFSNPETAKLMRKMLNRRQVDPYKNETPVERFQRLYRNPQGGTTRSSGSGSDVAPPPNPHVHRSAFRKNDSRTRRLQKLKQIWLSGPPDGSA